MVDNIKDVVIPILKNMQSDLAVMKTDIIMIKENSRKIDQRMSAMESHMAGLMATSRYHDGEMDELRGRVEHIENQPDPNNLPE